MNVQPTTDLTQFAGARVGSSLRPAPCTGRGIRSTRCGLCAHEQWSLEDTIEVASIHVDQH